MLLELLFKIIVLSTMIALLTPMKYSVRKSAVIIIALQLLIWMANYLCYTFISKPLIDDFLFFTIGIPGFFCFNVVAKYKGFRVLFTLLTVSVFSMFCDFIAHLNLPSGTVINNIIKYGSFVLVMVFIVKVFKKPYFKVLQTLERGWCLLCLIPFGLINVICLLQYYPTALSERPENLPVVIAAFVVTFVFYVIFYFNFENVSQLFQLRKDRQILSLQTDMYKNQYEAMTDSINSMKILRHDMKHHLNAIEAFVNDGRIAEAQKYMRTLNEDLNTTTVEKFCENYVVNVFLSSYIQKARNEKIAVDCEAEIPESIQADPVELGLVFANSLDNAIIACKHIEDVSERKITIACRQHYGQIFIRICNPFAGEVKFDGAFPVPESADHGTGTRSIAAIAQKYGGIFSFTAIDGIFKTTVTLNCRPTS